jgi:hypothetical protein
LIIRQFCDNQSFFNANNNKQLLHIWHQNLETFYNDYEMTFTAHAHLHLPEQVKRFGPLYKISFEGSIKHVKQYITGTRYVGKQILDRIASEKNIKEIARTLKSNTEFSV